MKLPIFAATALFAFVGAAHAQIAPIADLTDGAARTGHFVSGEDNFNAPNTWQVYTFSANAGDDINIRVSRLVGNADPVASVHFGDLTGADVTPDYDMFDLSDFGLAFLDYGDDNVDDPFGGPFGDPDFNIIAPADGTYTVITHMFGDYPNDPGYEIQVSGSSVPAPGAMALTACGGALCLRRRRR
jgi:hypothetical protein